ncbi:MAG: epoxyqueuosine reductase QueH [Bacilli bacterium]|nr:epoxyqueuosine reductase QueH [Bacilli bacterium]
MKNYYKEQLRIIDEIKNNKTKPTLLLHTCCALCFSSSFMQVKDYFDVTVFFYNPNIYPLQEYEKRKQETIRLINIFNEEFNTNIKFVEQIDSFESYNEKKVHKNKCFDCIHNRLLVSYNYANENEFDYISTTLTLGRLKNSEMINQIGEMLEPFYNTKYFYSNFKKNKGIDLSLLLKEKYNIYAQNYCGCEKWKKETTMKEYNFPKDFILGTATAAYQIEGARHNLDRCIWDDYAKMPGKVLNQEDGLVACDSYNRLDDDINILKELKVKAYRFSICLTRVINHDGTILEDGINYYKKLVSKLLENDIIPFITLYHWDLPSYLQDNGGWESEETVEWFINYCKVIFETFKNDVPFYITINEPFCVSHLGYGFGCHAPGIANVYSQMKASLNLLKAHGKVVELYKQLGYQGKIGICVNINDIRALSEKALPKVKEIKGRGLWWYFYPIATGKFDEDAFNYYKSIGAIGEISEQDYKYMTTCGDFIGLNHYNPEFYDEEGNFIRQENYKFNSLGWHVDATGIYNVVKEMASYTNKDIYILENGFATLNIDNVEKEIDDEDRVEYYHDYMLQVNKLVNEGINVKGYFAWSLLDNYEWAYGYSQRFGLVHVDYKTLNRTIKKSGYFFKKVCESTYEK